jgi:hypothetical protein
MTEQEWKTSTNLVEMAGFCKNRITLNQKRRFVWACRKATKRGKKEDWFDRNWDDVFETWTLKSVIIHFGLTEEEVAAMLRKVINPFAKSRV